MSGQGIRIAQEEHNQQCQQSARNERDGDGARTLTRQVLGHRLADRPGTDDQHEERSADPGQEITDEREPEEQGRGRGTSQQP